MYPAEQTTRAATAPIERRVHVAQTFHKVRDATAAPLTTTIPSISSRILLSCRDLGRSPRHGGLVLWCVFTTTIASEPS
eukprot:m.478502 g.478502  ORF g.478502 m.478502 type:complete len:79 (+) comp46799_c0_seq1:838-1074(+)